MAVFFNISRIILFVVVHNLNLRRIDSFSLSNTLRILLHLTRCFSRMKSNFKICRNCPALSCSKVRLKNAFVMHK